MACVEQSRACKAGVVKQAHNVLDSRIEPGTVGKDCARRADRGGQQRTLSELALGSSGTRESIIEMDAGVPAGLAGVDCSALAGWPIRQAELIRAAELFQPGPNWR